MQRFVNFQTRRYSELGSGHVNKICGQYVKGQVHRIT